ncbi:MAG TPA: 3'-5' exonuclease KapD [Patescibacteria group bacterium]|nr:3'-5' exonuclease KapD [Patescibacteria group bacterium]
MISPKNFLIADFEFTTFDTPFGRPKGFFPEIVEVGAVLLSTNLSDMQKVYQTFVKPRLFPKLSEACKNIAMLTQEDINQGIDWAEAMGKLAEHYTAGQTWLVAWGDADWQVIQNNCNKYKLDCPFQFADYLDLALAYRQYYAKDRTLSLHHAIDEQQIQREGNYHLALDDAFNTGLLLCRMWENGWRPE